MTTPAPTDPSTFSPLRSERATRYVTPMREGGSLPAIVEADDGGLYVLKFRGAGQGAKALVAELIAGEIARALGLPVPEIVFVDLDAELARTEPDPEIQELIRASHGCNLALDYLPGSVTFDPVIFTPDVDLASAIVWFDAFTSNVDRSARNTNMLIWHRRLWLIDHGAALYFHHAWDADGSDVRTRAVAPFERIRDHVLLPFADRIAEADARCVAMLDETRIDRIVAQVPDAWLAGDGIAATPDAMRERYRDYFCTRLRAPRRFVEEALRARAGV